MEHKILTEKRGVYRVPISEIQRIVLLTRNEMLLLPSY
jgi:hypothetical protein